MAFMSKVGNLLKQNMNTRLSVSNLSLFQAVRYMSSSKIFIGGLSYDTDDSGLREAFMTYGEVTETKVIMDRETGRSRGFGFVSFTSSDEASSAVQAMDGQDLHGRRVRVNYATDRAGGFRSDGGYGGGNNSAYAIGDGGTGGGYGGNSGGSYEGGDYGGNRNRAGGAYGGSVSEAFGSPSDGGGGVAGGERSYSSGDGNRYGTNRNGGAYGGSSGEGYGGGTFGFDVSKSGSVAGTGSNDAGGRFMASDVEFNGSSNQYNSDVGGSMNTVGYLHDDPLQTTNK